MQTRSVPLLSSSFTAFLDVGQSEVHFGALRGGMREGSLSPSFDQTSLSSGTEQNFDIAYALRQAGIHCLMFHYRGCWGSPGTYAIPNLEQDIDAAVSWLCEQPDVDTSKLAIVGHSLGGYHTLRMAITGAMYDKNRTTDKLKQEQTEDSDEGTETAQGETANLTNVYRKICSFAALCPLVGTDDVGVPLSRELSAEFASFLSDTSGPELQQQWAGLKSVKDMLQPLRLSQEEGQGNEEGSKLANNSGVSAEDVGGTSSRNRQGGNLGNNSKTDEEESAKDSNRGSGGAHLHTGTRSALLRLLGRIIRMPARKEITKSREELRQEQMAAKDAEDQIRRRAKPLLLITGDEDPLFSNEYYRKHLIDPLDNTLSFRYDWITKKHGDHALSRYRPEVVRHVVSFVCRSVGHNRWLMGERTACASRWIEAAPWDVFFVFAMGMLAGRFSVHEEYFQLQRELTGHPPLDLEDDEGD